VQTSARSISGAVLANQALQTDEPSLTLGLAAERQNRSAEGRWRWLQRRPSFRGFLLPRFSGGGRLPFWWCSESLRGARVWSSFHVDEVGPPSAVGANRCLLTRMLLALHESCARPGALVPSGRRAFLVNWWPCCCGASLSLRRGSESAGSGIQKRRPVLGFLLVSRLGLAEADPGESVAAARGRKASAAPETGRLFRGESMGHLPVCLPSGIETLLSLPEEPVELCQVAASGKSELLAWWPASRRSAKGLALRFEIGAFWRAEVGAVMESSHDSEPTI